MNGLRNSNFQENEIVKASDVQLVGDVAIENLGKALKTLFGSSKNVVIGGKLTAYTGGSGLMAKMDPILGISTASEIPFSDHEGKFYSDGDTEPSSYITFASAGSSNRRDLVEVKADTITAVEQSRQFYDPETETTSYAQTDTEKRTILRLKVKKGTNGSDTCPTTDSGYVKLAEVKIPANATSLSNSYIFNVTADIEGIDNTGWTAEKQVTINPGTLKDISTKFRAIHNSDGSLKDSVIAAAKIILSGSGALQGSAIQKGGSAEEIDGENVTATNSISTFFAKIAAKLRKVADKPTEVTQAEYDALKAAGKVEGKYFIITDAVGTEQPLIRDDLKNTTTVWSSSKTNTTINNALANQIEYNVVTQTVTEDNSNNCIPPLNKTIKYVTRGKDNQFGLIEAERTKNMNLANYHYCSQKFYLFGSNTAYQRLGSSTDSGTNWTWSAWEQIATNSALANYSQMYSDYDYKSTPLYYKIENINKTQILIGGRGGSLVYVTRFAGFYAKEIFKNKEDNITNIILATDTDKNIYVTLKANMGLLNVMASGGTIKVTKIDSLPSGLTSLPIEKEIVTQTDLNGALEGYIKTEIVKFDSISWTAGTAGTRGAQKTITWDSTRKIIGFNIFYVSDSSVINPLVFTASDNTKIYINAYRANNSALSNGDIRIKVNYI